MLDNKENSEKMIFLIYMTMATLFAYKRYIPGLDTFNFIVISTIIMTLFTTLIFYIYLLGLKGGDKLSLAIPNPFNFGKNVSGPKFEHFPGTGKVARGFRVDEG